MNVQTPPEPESEVEMPGRGNAREVALLFLRLGFTTFGGPAAHLAVMEDVFVHRRSWLDRRHFLDMLGAIHLIPGPNSTQLAMHIGLHRARFRGLVVAGACFILPATLIILPLAWLYVAYGSQPHVSAAMAGINACVVAILAAAVSRFGKVGIKDRFTLVLAIVGALADGLADPNLARRLLDLARSHPATAWAAPAQALGHLSTALSRAPADLMILFGGAILGMYWYTRHRPAPPLAAKTLLPMKFTLAAAALPAIGFAGGLALMCLIFLKIGATLFGSGYLLVNYLQSDFVDRLRWLTSRQLTDAIAVGQITPGPLLTTSTFIGFVLGDQRFGGGVWGGIAGGLLATFAIFLPSFMLIALLGRLLPHLRKNPLTRAALDAMNAVVVSLIFVVTIRLAIANLTAWPLLVITLACLALMVLKNVSPTWLILASGATGLILPHL